MTETLPSCNLVVLLSLYSVVITKTNLPNSLARTLNPLIETVDRFGRESKAVRYWNSLVHCFLCDVCGCLVVWLSCCVVMHFVVLLCICCVILATFEKSPSYASGSNTHTSAHHSCTPHTASATHLLNESNSFCNISIVLSFLSNSAFAVLYNIPMFFLSSSFSARVAYSSCSSLDWLVWLMGAEDSSAPADDVTDVFGSWVDVVGCCVGFATVPSRSP